MSRISTAMLTVGPKTLAPWGDRAWRVSLVAQLVEGASSPYWIVSPTQPAEHAVVPDSISVELPGSGFLIESIVMLLAAHLGDQHVEGYLMDTENIQMVQGSRHIAPYYDVSPASTFAYLTRRLSDSLRLSITVLDEFSMVDGEVVRGLRNAGFDVDVFGLISSGVDAP